MSVQEISQLFLYFMVLLLLAKPLAWYMTQIYEGKPCWINQRESLGAIEEAIYSLCGIRESEQMNWSTYFITMVLFNTCGFIFFYLLQQIQSVLPGNPQGFYGVDSALAFNTAASFISHTGWEAYSGEGSLSYLSQCMGVAVLQFLSAATSFSVLVAFIRGFVREESPNLGNYWVDMVRSVLYILLPLSFIFALFLSAEGVIQNFKPYEKVNLMQSMIYLVPVKDDTGKVIKDEQGVPKVAVNKVVTQTLPMGPVASQVAIKQIGGNGGGYFNTNAAHPYENPNPLTNFWEMIAILLIPLAFYFMFGFMVRDQRQGRVLLTVILAILIPSILICVGFEEKGNPILTQMVKQYPQVELSTHYNFEGKEVRFGIMNSALWTGASAIVSHGSENSMLDSYTPLGSLLPLWLMHMGNLSNLIIMMLLATFIANLMVGRSPEYLGKKIEIHEMRIICMVIFGFPITILIAIAMAAIIPFNFESISNPVPHGFTEIFYNVLSMGTNTGSAFAGFKANTIFYNMVGGLLMLAAHFGVAMAVLALAGSLARKKIQPLSSETLLTHTPLFGLFLFATLAIYTLILYLPLTFLGPIAEHSLLWSLYVN